MGGGTLTATREGGKIVLTDAAGTKATVTEADEKRSNGVVHHIDAVLMPAQGGLSRRGQSFPTGTPLTTGNRPAIRLAYNEAATR